MGRSGCPQQQYSQKITTNHNKSQQITQNKYKKITKKNSIHNKSQKITKITKNHKQSQKKNPIHKQSQKITNKKSYSQKITQNHKKKNPIHKKSQKITNKKSYSQKITSNPYIEIPWSRGDSPLVFSRVLAIKKKEKKFAINREFVKNSRKLSNLKKKLSKTLQNSPILSNTPRF